MLCLDSFHSKALLFYFILFFELLQRIGEVGGYLKLLPGLLEKNKMNWQLGSRMVTSNFNCCWRIKLIDRLVQILNEIFTYGSLSVQS